VSLRFCVDVCLPDRRWARASVPLWCIFLLAGVVGFTINRLLEIYVSILRVFCFNLLDPE